MAAIFSDLRPRALKNLFSDFEMAIVRENRPYSHSLNNLRLVLVLHRALDSYVMLTLRTRIAR